MNQARAALRRLAADSRGMTTVEYVIALCLVGAVSVGVWSQFGASVRRSLGQASVLIGDATRHATSGSGKDPE